MPVISQEMAKVSRVPRVRQLTAFATLRAWLSAMGCLPAHDRSMARHCPSESGKHGDTMIEAPAPNLSKRRSVSPDQPPPRMYRRSGW